MSGLQTTTTSENVAMHLTELRSADDRVKSTRVTFMGLSGFSATFHLDDRDLAKFAASIGDYLKAKSKK